MASMRETHALTHAPDGTPDSALDSAPNSAPGALMRLDMRVVSDGLANSRTRAARLIAASAVRVNGAVVTKASHKVSATDAVTVTERPQELAYVSRGAVKLLGAFDAFGPRGLAMPVGRDCLDIGASTGGFTQVLLEHGARRVCALDVGRDQLDPRLAADSRVIDMSGTNIREVNADMLPFAPRYVVSDVSFISLTYVIPVIARILADAAPGGLIELAGSEEPVGQRSDKAPVEIVLLIKPQFEVGRGHLGKNGIVTDEKAAHQAVERMQECARENGFEMCGCVDSPIRGEHGNGEYLLWLRWPHR